MLISPKLFAGQITNFRRIFLKILYVWIYTKNITKWLKALNTVSHHIHLFSVFALDRTPAKFNFGIAQVRVSFGSISHLNYLISYIEFLQISGSVRFVTKIIQKTVVIKFSHNNDMKYFPITLACAGVSRILTGLTDWVRAASKSWPKRRKGKCEQEVNDAQRLAVDK